MCLTTHEYSISLFSSPQQASVTTLSFVPTDTRMQKQEKGTTGTENAEEEGKANMHMCVGKLILL